MIMNEDLNESNIYKEEKFDIPYDYDDQFF